MCVQENLKKKKASSVFQRVFNEVLFCHFYLAWNSSQLPEQKEGLFYVVFSSAETQGYMAPGMRGSAIKTLYKYQVRGVSFCNEK